METEIVRSLFSLLESDTDEHVVTDLVVDTIEAFGSKYKNHTLNSEKASFDNFIELLKFKFQEETAETLVEAIQESNSGSLIMKFRDILFEVNQDFFYLKLHQTIDDMYQQPGDYKIDSKYLHLLNICLNSKRTFQHFYRHTALLMIKHLYPLNVQKFLDQFIFDIRIRQNSMDNFCKMYEDTLYFYIKIITNDGLNSDSDQRNKYLNYLGENLLKNLMSQNMLKFVIITTHFEKFRYLLRNGE